MRVAVIGGGISGFCAAIALGRAGADVEVFERSPAIREIGAAAAAKRGVRFLYLDLREAEAPEALDRGLYRQQYCGCVFSEAERYAPTTKHLYPPPANLPPNASAASKRI